MNRPCFFPAHAPLNSSEDITAVYNQIRGMARKVVTRFATPRFYMDFSRECTLSKHIFESDPIILALKREILPMLENDFGHGRRHSVKVSRDAGALMVIEAGLMGYDDTAILNRVRLAQSAGLLHDIRRKETDHAVRGADFSRKLLKSYPFSTFECEDICLAIRNHEAFKTTIPVDTPEGRLVGDCLYDADKFRWGPDNFVDTVWDMAICLNIPLKEFMERYPKGMAILSQIKTTFRTDTGRRYGPQFIDTGLAIGTILYSRIVAEFPGAL